MLPPLQFQIASIFLRSLDLPLSSPLHLLSADSVQSTELYELYNKPLHQLRTRELISADALIEGDLLQYGGTGKYFRVGIGFNLGTTY